MCVFVKWFCRRLSTCQWGVVILRRRPGAYSSRVFHDPPFFHQGALVFLPCVCVSVFLGGERWSPSIALYAVAMLSASIVFRRCGLKRWSSYLYILESPQSEFCFFFRTASRVLLTNRNHPPTAIHSRITHRLCLFSLSA